MSDCDKVADLVLSVLHARATQALQDEVDDEITEADPPAEVAHAALKPVKVEPDKVRGTSE